MTFNLVLNFFFRIAVLDLSGFEFPEKTWTIISFEKRTFIEWLVIITFEVPIFFLSPWSMNVLCSGEHVHVCPSYLKWIQRTVAKLYRLPCLCSLTFSICWRGRSHRLKLTMSFSRDFQLPYLREVSSVGIVVSESACNLMVSCFT